MSPSHDVLRLAALFDDAVIDGGRSPALLNELLAELKHQTWWLARPFFESKPLLEAVTALEASVREPAYTLAKIVAAKAVFDDYAAIVRNRT